MPEQDLPNTSAELASPPPGELASVESPSPLDALAAERDRLAQERDEISDRYLRLAAEFDNFRKRSERERLEAIEYAATGTVSALLPILDDFERALKIESQDVEYARGLQLIYQRLFDALTKLGLERVPAEGQPFDPNLHYAIERVEDTGAAGDTVIAELQRGYSFKGRLLRAAMVRVAVKS